MLGEKNSIAILLQPVYGISYTKKKWDSAEFREINGWKFRGMNV
jgi:hypothetical protein